MTNLPPIPTGDSALVRWARAVHDRVFNRLRIVDSPDILAQETTRGISLKIKPGTKATPATSAEVQIFCIVGLTGADTMVCRTWDGTTIGGTDITVAKSPHLWTSIASDTVDGVSLTYTYAAGDDPNNLAKMADNYRTASDTVNTESQIVYPRYQAIDLESPSVTPGTIITACKPKNGTLQTGVEWMEISPHRVWARCYVQL